MTQEENLTIKQRRDRTMDEDEVENTILFTEWEAHYF